MRLLVAVALYLTALWSGWTIHKVGTDFEVDGLRQQLEDEHARHLGYRGLYHDLAHTVGAVITDQSNPDSFMDRYRLHGRTWRGCSSPDCQECWGGG